MPQKNIPKKISILIALFSTCVISYSVQVHAELKYNLTGEIGASVKHNNSTTTFNVDETLIGFRARTPMGYGVVNVNFANATDTSKLLEEAYIHKSISPIFSARLGLQSVLFGMHAWDGEDIFISDSFNQRLGLYQATGLTGTLKYSDITIDGGFYNAATRAEITPRNAEHLSNVKESPLYVVRGSYQKGNILYIQGSYALQEYSKISGLSRPRASELLDLGIHITASPVWSFTFNLTKVKRVYGESSNTQSSTLSLITWKPDHLWDLFIGTYRLAGDQDNKHFLWGGFKYYVDNHNQILFNFNLDGETEKYKGLFEEIPATAEIQYKVKF